MLLSVFRMELLKVVVNNSWKEIQLILALWRMKGLSLVITLLFSVIITGEWSDDHSRQNITRILRYDLGNTKVQQVRNLFAINWPVSGFTY